LHPDEIESRAEPAVPHADLGEVSSQISRQIVQLHARLYGRGPTRAKTYITQDYLLSVLEEIFTTAERTLIAAGKGEHVQTTRMAFQDAVKDAFIAIVEETTGRPVRTLISQVDLETGVAIELFLFEPATDGAPPRPQAAGGDR
jgi:uncharacterized protein YbcI